MAIQYSKLFKLLEERGIQKTELQKGIGISSATMAKLTKNEPVSLKVIEEICGFLKCQPGEIMEMEQESERPLLKLLREEKEMKLKGGLYHQTQIKLAITPIG